VRASRGLTPTEYRYTNQRYENSLGLSFYVARWYDPVIAHFVQADTIVPRTRDTQSYDRYAYADNNPTRYTDPKGHSRDCGIGDTNCRAGKLLLQDAVLIIACGAGTDGACEAGRGIYDDVNGDTQVPLYGVADYFWENGGQIVYQDYSSYINTNHYAQGISELTQVATKGS
jgi:RHS repeat-associated protein